MSNGIIIPLSKRQGILVEKSNRTAGNIFRVMGDMITQSIGNAYGYKIGDENFAIFFENVSLLDSLLQKVVPKTQSEEFVLKVYEKFKSGETNSWGDKEIISEVEVLLKL